MRATVAVTLCLGACTPTLGGGVPQTGAALPTAGTRSGAAPLATKRVRAKRPPATLLAEDGTVCEMAPEAFEHTAVGAMVRCAWMRDPAGR